MRKKLLALAIALCMLIGMLPAAVLAAETDFPSEDFADPASYEQWKQSLNDTEDASLMSISTIHNDYIEIALNSTGTFTIGTVEGDPESTTDNNKKMLFGHPSPWSSRTLIRIGDRDYIFSEYVTSVEQVSADEFRATAVIEGVTVTQILTMMENSNTGRPDVVSIRYTYRNNTDAVQQIGVRIMLDTMLGNNDGAPFRVNGEALTTEREYIGDAVPQRWQSFDHLDNPTVVSTGSFYFDIGERPDKVQFAYWGNIYSAGWDYTISTTRAVTSDSAVAAYFNPRSIPVGGTGSVVTYYGISSYIPSDQDDKIDILVTNPVRLYAAEGGGYSNNPFSVTAYLANTGTTSLENVRAVMTLEDGSETLLQLRSGSMSQELGTLGVNEQRALEWSFYGIPQTVEATAYYTLRVYAGDSDEPLAVKELHTTLSALTEVDMYRIVTFESNGGTPVAPQRVLIGHTLTIPDEPTKDGFTFGGWFANPTFAGAPWFNDTLPNGSPITRNMTLYARWLEGDDLYVPGGFSHTVTFRAEGLDIVILVVEDGGSIPSSDIPAVPPRVGYSGAWDVTEFYDIRSDLIVNAIYWENQHPTSLTVDPTELTLRVGETYPLTAVIEPADADPTLIWRSSNPEVATVDENGRVTAVSDGSATITVCSAVDETISATCLVTVTGTTVVLTEDEIELRVGDTHQLVWTILPEGTEADVVFTSFSPAIATVDENGLITGVQAGTAVVQISTADGSSSDACNVIVTRDAVIDHIEIIQPTDPVRIQDQVASNNAYSRTGALSYLDVSGLQVFAVKDDGSREEVFDYTLIPGMTDSEIDQAIADSTFYDFDNPENNIEMAEGVEILSYPVTVKYLDFETEFTVSVKYGPRVLTGLYILSKPTKRRYVLSEALDLSGLQVMATYSDASQEAISPDSPNEPGYIVTGYNPDQLGPQAITIAYGGKSTQIQVNVFEANAVQNDGGVTVPRFLIESFLGGKTVAFESATQNTTIYYTTDGTVPTAENGTRFVPDFTEPIRLYATTTIKAIAVNNAGETSEVITGRISVPQTARPMASHPEGELPYGTIVTLRSTTSGATIYYSTDGQNPIQIDDLGVITASESGILYNGAIRVEQTETIWAVAVKDGYRASEDFRVTYEVAPPVLPTDSATIALGSVTGTASQNLSLGVSIFTQSSDSEVAPEINSFRFGVAYDFANFSFAGISPVEGIEASQLFVSDDAENGYLTILCTDVSVSSGDVCVLSFHARASDLDGTYALAVDEENVSLTVSSNRPLVLSFVSGAIELEHSPNSNLTGEIVFTDTNGNDINRVAEEGEENADEINVGISIDDSSLNSYDQVITTVNVMLVIYNRRGAMSDLQQWEIDLSDISALMFMQRVTIPRNVDVGAVKVIIVSEDNTPMMMSTGLRA